MAENNPGPMETSEENDKFPADELRPRSKSQSKEPTQKKSGGSPARKMSEALGSRVRKMTGVLSGGREADRMAQDGQEGDVLSDTFNKVQAVNLGHAPNSPIHNVKVLLTEGEEEAEYHAIFCELMELEADSFTWVWKERARWVKYEERVEEGGSRFSKPYVTPLTIQSVLEVRHCLKKGTVLLDVKAETWKDLIDCLTKQWSSTQKLSHQDSVNINVALMAPKRHLVGTRLRSFVQQEQNTSDSEEESTPRGSKINQSLLRKLAADSEAAMIMTGKIAGLSQPLAAFVRLREAKNMHPAVPELPIPVRFAFFLLYPTEHFEGEISTIGRCVGTLMVDDVFSHVAYSAQEPHVISEAVEEFMSETVLLPPAMWNPKTRLEPQDDGPPAKRPVGKRETLAPKSKHKHDEVDEDLRRTGMIFGGLVADIKRKGSSYLSDYVDAFRGRFSQTLAAAMFLFFANVTSIITFGGVMGNLLDGYMGAMENLLCGGLCGVVYALFSGQPLTILSATGPTLAFEAILYEFCKTMEFNYMPVRLWVGVWTAVILMLIVAFDATVIISLITRFTEEAFATLIAIIFIFDGFKQLIKLEHKAPITTDPIAAIEDPCICNDSSNIFTVGAGTNKSIEQCSSVENATMTGALCHFKPDVFMFSVLLFIGTYVICMALKNFRHSGYLPSKIRQSISDFNVFIAIVIMTLINYFVGLDVPSLDVPSKFEPTRSDRNWLIDPMGIDEWWVIFAAILPALFLCILIFMDQQITAVIVNRPDNKLKKGFGYHLDLFVLSLLIFTCSFLGLPFYVAATVLAIMHVDSLRVMSESAAPGEKPVFLGVKEQRVTALIAHLIIGLSVFLTSVIRLVPMPVLLGIFLYMGVVTLTGQQFFHRFLLMFMPVKHQPDYSYLRVVQIKRIHIFTVIQLVALGLLFAVKNIKAVSMEFPLMLILTVVIRKLLDKVFTRRELAALDDLMPPFSALCKTKPKNKKLSSEEKPDITDAEMTEMLVVDTNA